MSGRRVHGIWQEVLTVEGPFVGRGSCLGPDTWRRTRWWELELACGHTAERTVRYGPHQDGRQRQRGGSQKRLLDDVLPPPKRVLCQERHEPEGEPSPTGCPMCSSDDYDTEPGPDGTPDYENGRKRCQECGEEWV